MFNEPTIAAANLFVTLGTRELLDQPATLENLAETLRPLDRDEVIRLSVRVLNALAHDWRFRDSQLELVAWLPQAAQAKLKTFLRNRQPQYRLFHPFQQLILIHLAARYAKGEPSGPLPPEERRSRWAMASIQINDNLVKDLPSRFTSRKQKMLYLFSEEVARWEISNPSQPIHSLARMRSILLGAQEVGQPYAEAAARLRARFVEQLGLDFESVFNLTAFFMSWWRLHSEKIPENPDAALIDRRNWLTKSSISRESLDRYVDRIAISAQDIESAFEKSGAESPFRDVLPFRSRPILRLGEHGLAYLCPQFMSEKGGTDLLWLLASDPGGDKQSQPFIQDFSVLYERYVRSVLEAIGRERLGGTYIPNLRWSLGEESGEIDGLFHFGKTLAVIEVKASLLRQTTLSRGTADEVRSELEKKFVVGGEADGPKGLLQIARAISWLANERKKGRTVEGVNLATIETILPLLIVHDRALRFPGLGAWFDGRMRDLLRKSWGRIGPLTICGTEDLESLEHLAATGQKTLADVLGEYDRRYMKAEAPLWNVYDPPREQHPRLDRITNEWMEELESKGILPKE